MILLLLTLMHPARAQEPETSGEVMVIQAHRELERTRAALEQAILAQGFRRLVDRQGRTVFPRPALWKTKVVLYDDGRIELRTRGLVPMMILPSYTAEEDKGEEEVTVMLHGAGLISGPRTVQKVESQLLEAVEPALVQWRDALWAEGLAVRRTALREELREVWTEGRSPDGQVLPEPAQRRAWILEAWLNTSDNEAGEAVRAEIEVFLDEVVQGSTTPLTPAEVEAVNARRAFERRLQPAGLEAAQ